ncbi:putative RNA methyltransferase [Brachybacterium sp. GCM10030252]|uniref:putative RNA methyltransferase n=1 Tax=Brachybacterium sp. GCM10030252 TaxID=3273380 RepID=UPI0036128396
MWVPTAVPSALAGLLDALRCPACGGALQASQNMLRCSHGHTFDLARAGYVSLLSGSGATSGDDDEMARARQRFLATGAYAPLLEAIGDLAESHVPDLAADAPRSSSPAPTILDAGCGPGYYLAGLLDRFPAARGLGFDTSVRSLRFAARSHDRAAVCSADVFAPLPLADGCADLLLDAFAPRNPTEFARVLRPGGSLIVVRPLEGHLAQLRDLVPGMVAVDPHKEERLHAVLDPHFAETARRELHVDLSLSAETARDLAWMTPSARHLEVADLDAALARLDPASPPPVTVSVLISVHRPR